MIRKAAVLNPDEPKCVDGETHRWSNDYELIGGIKENPGVWGHGGGVYHTSVCTKCDLKRTYEPHSGIVADYIDDLNVNILLNLNTSYQVAESESAEGNMWSVWIVEEPVTKLWAVISITELVGGSSDENLEGWYLTENEANDEAEGLVNNLSR
jgi:hypothetical protein